MVHPQPKYLVNCIILAVKQYICHDLERISRVPDF